MIPVTEAVTQGEVLADDLVKLINNIDQEREPLRHRRVMHRLIVMLQKDCLKEKSTPEEVVAAECSELPPAVQQELINILHDEMDPQPVIAAAPGKTDNGDNTPAP